MTSDLCSNRPTSCCDASAQSLTFTLADAAALPALPVSVAAVFVAGEGRTADAAAHLTAVLIPPESRNNAYDTGELVNQY